jgi:iron complex outermembrane recepter protein
MNGKIVRDRLLASTIIAGAVAFSAPVFAQTAGAPATAPDSSVGAPSGAAAPAGEIVVTGSRLPQPNLTSASPVTVLNSQDIKQSGVTRVEDLINQLPQAFGDQGGGISNGATGTSTVNLRNLGANRTLVLINGRRLVPGDPSDSAADLNFIPASLIKRVDVLTGGASATYGADAVGGVVNFVMDSNFSGFKVDSQYSMYQHDNNSNYGGLRTALNNAGYGYPSGNSTNGGTVDATATIGAGFDDNRGHVVAYVGYRKIKAVTQASRDYSSCSIAGSTPAQVAAGANKIRACSGSFTSSNFLDGSSSSYQLGAGRTFVPGSNTYNFAPANYYQRPDERYTAGFFAHYDVSDAFKPYMEGMFMDDRSIAQIAPSGDFGNTTTINCDNPLLSAQQLGIACAAGNLVDASGNVGGTPAVFTDPTTGATYNKGYLQAYKRNTEGGPRRDDLQHTSYRFVVGAKGDIAKGLSYDAYYQYGRTNYSETYYNDVSASRLSKALDVVTDTRAGSATAGQPICRSVLDGSDANCVPYNIFTNGGITSGALNYISVPGFQRAQVSEQVASGSITALLGEYGVQSPWANEGVALNVGGEYRKEQLNFTSDAEFQTGDLTGQGAATLPVTGAYNVKEVFAEVRAPIIHDGFIYDLTVDGGYRFSSYNINGKTNTNTFKGEVTFAPVKDVSFRFSYNRAVRAPNIQELFAPRRIALDGSNDPCAGTPELTEAQCANTGLTAAQYNAGIIANPAQQYNGLIGGNPNLKPEKSDTFTVGMVLQPHWVPGLAVTVDAFSIKVKNVIQNIGEDTIIQSCGVTGDPALCGLIHRDSSGSLWRTQAGYVEDTYLNLGSLKTRGIDVGASYSHEIGKLGSLGFNLNGTYLDEFRTDNGVSTPYDCAGYYGTQCGTPAPKWRHRARVTYTAPNGIGLSAQWRYYGPVKVDASSSNDTLSGNFPEMDRRIAAQSYFDLTLTAAITDKYTFRLGVNNVLDRDPPLVSSADLSSVYGNGNTYPNVYDALGRYVFAGVTANF